MEPRSTAVGQQAMRVLVLGSSGLVGAAVVDCLRAAAIEVVPFDIEGTLIVMGSQISTPNAGELYLVKYRIICFCITFLLIFIYI